MNGFESVVSRLAAFQIKGEIWVDGSFLTRKTDPNDVDFVLKLNHSDVEVFSDEQFETIDWLESSDVEKAGCHAFVFVQYPVDHPLRDVGEADFAYWRKQWTYSREYNGNVFAKGIAVVELAHSWPP